MPSTCKKAVPKLDTEPAPPSASNNVPSDKSRVFPLPNLRSEASVCSEPETNFTLASTSVCNSAIAVLTVDADVPNAAAEIVPSLVLIVAISVSLEFISPCNSLIAPA